jgi:hypothetical protein
LVFRMRIEAFGAEFRSSGCALRAGAGLAVSVLRASTIETRGFRD